MAARPQPSDGIPPGGAGPRPGPSNTGDKSRELLDAVNALAYGVTSLSEMMPSFIQTLEGVSRQFAVLIALEAQRRNTNADTLIQQTLLGLAQNLFKRKA